MHIIRITPHPTASEVVVLKVPYEANKVMALFEGAQLAPDLRGYITHVSLLPAFERFAAYNGMLPVEERRLPADHTKVEQLCDRCGKPENQCETAAGNTGRFKDHEFTTQAQGGLQRHPRRHA
jgi:hypothetical protein